MTEDEVNLVCQQWLVSNGYAYKGILNVKPKITKERNGKNSGWGQVAVPDGKGQVLIDHQGISDKDRSIIWIEAKGGGDAFSELLQGFIRLLYACYHGGGKGLLAVPEDEYNQLLEQRDFLAKVTKAGERKVGLFNAENNIVKWLWERQ